MTREKLLDILDTILIEEYVDFDSTDYPDQKGHQNKVEALNAAINIFTDMSDAEFKSAP